jgi:hypothetical protein
MSRTCKILARLPQSLCAVAALAFVALIAVADVGAQTPAATGPSASPAPPAPHATAAAVAPVGLPTPKPVHHHYGRASATPGYAAVSAANAGARAYATPDAYINAVLYYDYEAGRIYTLQTSPRFLTTILLRPGEKLIAKAAGDTVRWVLGETVQGAGTGQQVVVLIKPIRGGLKTNVVLTTDQRTYLLEAVSHDGGTYTSAISWNYPQEQMQALSAAQAQAAPPAPHEVAALAAPARVRRRPEDLHPVPGEHGRDGCAAALPGGAGRQSRAGQLPLSERLLCGRPAD